MKKVILALFVLILIPTTVLAWDDCPRDEVLCEGKCGLFVDTDGDGICDRSQPAPEDRNNGIENAQLAEERVEEVHELVTGEELKTKTVNEMAEIYQIGAIEFSEKISEYLKTDVKPNDSFQFLHDNYGLEPNVPKDIATTIRAETQVDTSGVLGVSDKRSKKTYHLLPISLFLIILYAITHGLSKKKIISIVNHRKMWNVLLLITFLISGIFGVLLVIRVNFGRAVSLPFDILFWHVEIGTAMFVISIFHVLWHWVYFKSLFKVKSR